jgi:predicted DNA binding protein
VLTAKVCVQYEGDWTAALGPYGVFGEFLASTFHEEGYVGLVALETTDFAEVVATIEGHETVDELELVERYPVDRTDRTTGTLYLQGSIDETTPLQTLLRHGYLPLGPTKLEHGRECFDLLLTDRSALASVTDMLDTFGPVEVERISQEFRREITPSTAEWQELLSAIPPRQREVLNLALERGYFEVPRDVTLAEIADEMDVTKTTASNHLRKAQGRLMEFLVRHVNLAASDE